MDQQKQYLADYLTVVKPKSLTMFDENKLLYGEATIDTKTWIKKQKQSGKTWSSLYYANKGNFDGLKEFISRRIEEDNWSLSPEEYQYLVYLMFISNKNTWPVNPDTYPKLNTNDDSAWSCYHHLLTDNPNFSFESIENITNSSQYILSHLLNAGNTTIIKRPIDDPVRGMVVGNVQSGKTANMEALISMAADYKYNFFIILSGTIENLRRQNRNRIVNDFCNVMMAKYQCHYNFNFLDQLSKNSEQGSRLVDLDLTPNSNQRYVFVCLKNTKRLADLRIWLNKSLPKKQQLNVLLIDDEADQASLNGAKIDNSQSTMIHSEICDIVFGKDLNGNKNPYGAISYIGYTATPYGNFLNEANDTSLYPTDFICGLKTPNEYIGPQQLFGVDGVIDSTLPVINIIQPEEIFEIKEHISFSQNTLPLELKKAVLWFLSTVAIFRLRSLNSPVSMLIHTSQRIEEHKVVYDAISSYLNELIKAPNRLDLIKDEYEEQTSKETKEDFKNVMVNYHDVDKINDYPPFEDLIDQLNKLLNIPLGHIMLDETGDLKYSEGLHLCIDNCKIQSNYPDDDIVMRILYPDNKEDDKKCPAFIVVGGQTLSRGLTLKGLTVSYFLRSTVLGDTLMQMGRWFGYRVGYELLCRLWISKTTQSQFQRLSKLDYDLRELIDQYRVMNWNPKQYAPSIDSFPDFRYLKITSNNHMQNVKELEMSFANKKGQTTKFFADEQKNKANYDYAVDFVNGLGNETTFEKDDQILPLLDNKELRNHHVWLSVPHDMVFNFLSKLKFPRQVASFESFDNAQKWFDREFNQQNLKDFSVVIPSLQRPADENNIIHCKNTTINPITRSRIIPTDTDIQDQVFRIPVITGPFDLICDVDSDTLNEERLHAATNGKMTIGEKRTSLGMSEIPLLVLYFIDKHSRDDKRFSDNSKKESLNLENNLFGYYIYIPTGKDVSKIISDKVTVKLDFDAEKEKENEDEVSM